MDRSKIHESGEVTPLGMLRKRGADSHRMNHAVVPGAVVDHGQIESIDLPPGWVESSRDFYSGVGTRSFRMFHPPETTAAALCFYYRGLLVSQGVGARFCDLLRSPPHELKADEFCSISEVLRDKSRTEWFVATRAATCDVNGRRVLIVSGRYRQNGNGVVHMFVNADGAGRAVQEIYFQADPECFAQYEDQARASLNSIHWK